MTDPVKYDEQAALEDCSEANGRRTDHPDYVDVDPDLEAMFFAALMLGGLSFISLTNAETVLGQVLGAVEGVAAVACWKASQRSA